MLTPLPSFSNYESPSGDSWGRFFLGLLGGIALAIGILVLVNLKDDGQLVAPSYVTQEELQQAINTMGQPISSGRSISIEESKAHKAAPSSSSQRSRSMSSAGAIFSTRPSENVVVFSRASVSSRAGYQVSAPVPESPHMWIRTVRWTWPVPVVPAEGQAVVGRILFRNSCVGSVTVSRIRMVYSGPNPFLMRSIALVDTSTMEPLTELTPLALNTSRRSGDVELLLDPPVELQPCERDPAFSFDERRDLFSMDVVVEAQVDQNDWSVHTLYFMPEWVTADGLVVWDDKVNPAEGIFQFFTGKDAGQKSQEDGQE